MKLCEASTVFLIIGSVLLGPIVGATSASKACDRALQEVGAIKVAQNWYIQAPEVYVKEGTPHTWLVEAIKKAAIAIVNEKRRVRCIVAPSEILP